MMIYMLTKIICINHNNNLLTGGHEKMG